MKLVLLTADGLEHRYVANRLCEELPIAAVVVDEHVRTPSIRRAFRGGAANAFGRMGLRGFRRLIHDDRACADAVRRVLGADQTETFRAERVVRVDGINGPDARATVGGVDPDALLVYGTTIVREPMLRLARDLAFNLHTGISPRYRGTDCAFWPIVNGEPEWVGATVHECTQDVDGGQIFATAQAHWHADDGIHELFARAVMVGADMYVDAVRRYLDEGRIEGERQDLASGREYRASMRTLAVELRARRALRRGLLRRSGAQADLQDLQAERGK